jgi:hypothetical protein
MSLPKIFQFCWVFVVVVVVVVVKSVFAELQD